MTARERAAQLWGRHSPRHLVAVSLALAVGMPTAVEARPFQEEPPGGGGSGGGATLSIDVDVASDNVEDVSGALDDILDNVLDQYDDLLDARADLDDADGEWQLARDAVDDTQDLIDGLVELSDGVVVGTYVSPPNMADIDSLSTANPGDLAIKQVLLDLRAQEDGDVLGALADARDELADRQADEEDAAADANEARLDAQDALADLEDAAGQQTLFFSLIEDRLEHGAGELAFLADVDPEAAALLQDDHDALLDALQDILDDQELAEALETLAAAQAAQEEEEPEPSPDPTTPEPQPSEPAPEPSTIGAASGNLSTVSCPGGGSITVDSSLAGNLGSLLNAASSSGLSLCGSGYRDPQRQIELRQQHCGTSYYAIYEMPASQCSPPTARPGTSMHERGLAVDFQNCATRSTACYQWLASNAGSYGLYNLPSEPWHWSTDGT